MQELTISKSSGMLTDKLKEELKATMKKDSEYISKVTNLTKNAFLHNDFIYTRLIKSIANYYVRMLSRAKIFDTKVEWIEAESYHWLVQMIKIL